MSRRKIKAPGGHAPKPRGRHATREADMYKRHQPIRALENMRRHTKALKELEDAKAAEAEAEKARAESVEAEKGADVPEEGPGENG